ncbi:FadR/GntR family transcriptional regulator [Arthrobacter castelli]|uniref:FadR/GntR family transcriptional regulator n=1 Tax=Arthrobacter castelli TaxID=271431 RepID=UPI000427C9B7|nr:FCD domain-containing protein [Arthrobacter castelli]
MTVDRIYGVPNESGGLTRFEMILDAWGRRIVSGEFGPGQVVRLEDLEREFNASRTIIRDVVRVLEAAGIVASSRRVGITVQPASDWNHLDARLLEWQLDDPLARPERLLRLSELRYAVEPVAASLMAADASPGDRSRLVLEAEKLLQLATESSEEFMRGDIAFHARILRSSGNNLFMEFEDGFAAAIRGRHGHSLMPERPDPAAVQLHVDAAHAIFHGDQVGSAEILRRLLGEVLERFTPAS